MIQSTIEQILRESKILAYTNKKYNKANDVAGTMLIDPYYRFGRILEEVQEVIQTEDGSWLDLGCHHGQFLELANKIFQYKTTGMDDWDLKAELPFTDFDYFKVDLANSDWTNLIAANSMNVVSALEVIEHMIDTERFLQNCKSRLVSNGYLVLSTPNISCLRNRILVPFGKYPAYMEYKNIIHHVRLFNVPVIKSLLEQNGFIVKKATAVSFWPEKFNRFPLIEKISKGLAKLFPNLCGNLIVIAQKAD